MGSVAPNSLDFIDIRHNKTESSLRDAVRRSLQPADGSGPSLPTLLLYNEQGLKIFEDITYLDEYYLTNAEIEVLTSHADAIVARVAVGTRLIELGSGNLRKVKILLQAFERAQKAVQYYALDLSLSELERTFSEIDIGKLCYVSLNALHGTYDDMLSWLSEPQNRSQPVCVMTLGSSLGNLNRTQAASFLKSFKDILGPSDWMVIGLDACQDRDRVYKAYNDSHGVTERFYRNGLDHANELLGHELFKQSQWAVEGIYDDVDHKHEASYIALSNVDNGVYKFSKGDKILLEYAYKYSEEQSDTLWHSSGLIPQVRCGNAKGDYHIHMLSPSSTIFPTEPSAYAAEPVPSLEDWQLLWSAWDTVTKSMVPRDELMNKPIQLRNNLIFYLGHIPTFADIHYMKATGSKATEPAYYSNIFERGIDPDVDDPELCHDHSEIPDTWPPLEEILEYSFRVRSRILDSIRSGKASKDPKLGRGLWLAYEHEAMHLETFLYMLLQSSRVLPPPGSLLPDFAALATDARREREENQWHRIPTSEVEIGLNDPENNLPPPRYFGWDNERPTRKVQVSGFAAQSRGISNGEYAAYLEDVKLESVPSSWIVGSGFGVLSSGRDSDQDSEDGLGSDGSNSVSRSFLADKAVRTVFGKVPLEYALEWPVMASYNELAAYAEWAGGRIPTFEEARSIYLYVDNVNKLKTEKKSSMLISAVNGHLSNNGVEETPPTHPSGLGDVGDQYSDDLNPNKKFIDLGGCNVAFKSWHPTPITGEGSRLRGQSDTGGLWEWTSSPLRKYEGFKAMDLYPGYTADFFDEKHNICLGGSWATVPRLAGRRSFVNWYQRNYPYTWATARLVRDL